MKPLILLLSLFLFHNATASNPPFKVKDNLFNHELPEDLGLAIAKGTETTTIFRPGSSDNAYNNGAVLCEFNNRLFCQWQSSAKDEDAADTKVVYSYSKDGKNWNAPISLSIVNPDNYQTSGGWWKNGDTLVAFINVWPVELEPKGGFTLYRTTTDGISWSGLKPVLMENGDTLKGILEQDLHRLANGRIVGAAHFQPGLIVSPIFTDDPSGVKGWTRANFTPLAIKNNVSRELEPSLFEQSNSNIVMVFRDQFSSFKRLASVSTDNGENWSEPVLTNMPDSRSKQSAGNLPDGTAYLVGNPVSNKQRFPLAIALSKNGEVFTKAYLLRAGGSDLQPLRYEGKYKRAGYHYPKSMVAGNFLYVAYTSNKEDVEYTRIPLESLDF